MLLRERRIAGRISANAPPQLVHHDHLNNLDGLAGSNVDGDGDRVGDHRHGRAGDDYHLPVLHYARFLRGVLDVIETTIEKPSVLSMGSGL